uniref:Putative secreted protein n=1 Tax=Anopheles darlingi TaxID=43151 RepID=A0A2M4DD76_ANODA
MVPAALVVVLPRSMVVAPVVSNRHPNPSTRFRAFRRRSSRNHAKPPPAIGIRTISCHRCRARRPRVTTTSWIRHRHRSSRRASASPPNPVPRRGRGGGGGGGGWMDGRRDWHPEQKTHRKETLSASSFPLFF